jgi:glycosyltransferase involved in cell wall biosynthesis
LQVDVAHVTLPVHIAANCPTVFNPHDLRHVRYPEYYERQALQRRRRVYPAACRDATLVDTFSQATKENVVEAYDVDAESVYPLPLGPSHTGSGTVGDALAAEVRSTYDLPESFLLYPANTWPHKNHRLLVDALEHVEETHGERLPLVCTGGRDDRGVSSEHRIADLAALDPAGRLRDLGFVDSSHLRALFRECRLLVYPSQFEGGGLPVIEGWQFDTPVVCSDIPPLREKGGDAAAYFDPSSASDIGETVYEAWTDPTLRAKLVERGRQRRELFTWDRTARAYHALYRKAAGRELSDGDEAALAYPPG